MKPVPQALRRLSDEQIIAILKTEREGSLGTNTSSDLSDQRIRALDYYMGDMWDEMPAEEGRSAAVSTDVQDVVEGVLPIILDVFTSGDKVVEFKPRGPNDEAAAAQETDAVNYVFFQENDGFLTLYTAIKDALIQKNCFVQWWMEEEEDRARERYEGLTADAFAMLTTDTEIEVVSQEQYQAVDPATQQPAQFFNAVVERVKNCKRAHIMAVPPEEVLVSKNARNIRDASYLAHVTMKPQADLIVLYPDFADVIREAPSGILTADNYEAFERQTVQDNEDQLMTTEDVNKDMRLIETVTHFTRLALEKDGIARRYRITTIGTKYDILDLQEVSNWAMASGTGIIMPHRLFGRSLADLTIDIQEIKTSLIRATLDNAYYANNQRVEIAETHAGENTIDDLLNNRVGGIVRTKMPGGINPLPAQPIGNWVQGTIEYFDSVKENRTGVSRYNQGLDADSLNHTATGITRIMDAAEMRIKLMTRIFAETLIVDMFRGLHQLLQEHGEEALDVKINGAWVKVDPREWKKRTHMSVTLPLGGIGKQQMLQFFSHMLDIQNAAVQQQGSGNGPLVSYQNIYNTLDKMTQLGGLKSVDPYFMKPGPPNPNAPPPPNPKMVEAQASAQATQATQQHQQQLDAAKAQTDLQLAQQKQAADQQRDAADFAHKTAMERAQFDHDSQMEQLKVGSQMRLEAFKTTEKMKLEREKADQTAALNRQQASLEAKPGVNNV